MACSAPGRRTSATGMRPRYFPAAATKASDPFLCARCDSGTKTAAPTKYTMEPTKTFLHSTRPRTLRPGSAEKP